MTDERESEEISENVISYEVKPENLWSKAENYMSCNGDLCNV